MPRLIALRVILLLILTVMIGRLYQIQIGSNDSPYYSDSPTITTRRSIIMPPRRGEILAADGTTLLAESVPIYNIALIPGRLPSLSDEPDRRAMVLGRLSQIAELTSTLELSPTTALDTIPRLRSDLNSLGALPELQHSSLLTITIPPALTLQALDTVAIYSDVLRLNNPIEDILLRNDVRRYQSLIIKEGISPELALVIRENSNYLPGVQVVEGFQRRYPQSGNVPSLSHMLGYIGRINECELLAENPASSWLSSLMDVVSHSGNCGLIPKQIDPTSLGLSPYGSDDRIGKDGLEAAYEAELRGRIGVESLLVDALERPISAPNTTLAVENGHNLVLTIDLEFQAEVERIMRRWIAEGERRRLAAAEQYKRDYKPITNGVAVVLDPHDGRVLAMVSIPDYDNNVWVDLSRGSELTSLLVPEDPSMAPLVNRAIAGRYPPGSTLKQFVGAIALQNNIIAADSKLRDPGLLRLIERSGQEFILPNSVRTRDNGELTVMDALRVSSNVFFASIAGGNDQVTNLDEDSFRTTGIGIDNFDEGLQWFGLGRLTGVDLAGEVSGLIPTRTWKAQNLREAWTTGDTYNMAIGQGYLTVTPLQLAMAAGGVATDGTIYQPHVVDHIVDQNGEEVREIPAEVKTRAPVDQQYLAAIRQGMRDSVTNGLNISARNECSGLSIAGKTGTAEFGPIITNDGKRQSHSWFVGFAPYENPEIVVAVLLEGTGDLGDGSSTMAVPAVTQIMQAYFNTQPPADAPSTCPAMPTDPAPPTVAQNTP